MITISNEIIFFLEKQGFVIVSTLDAEGGIHCAAKGIVGIDGKGIISLLDLYKGNTFCNLTKNNAISITAVDEHAFIGYTLKGTAAIVDKSKIKNELLKKWEEKVINRISKRLIKHIKEEKKSLHHPEVRFPSPCYLIEMQVEQIINLAPAVK